MARLMPFWSRFARVFIVPFDVIAALQLGMAQLSLKIRFDCFNNGTLGRRFQTLGVHHALDEVNPRYMKHFHVV